MVGNQLTSHALADNESLVAELRASGALRSPAVIEAFRTIRRAAFVPYELSLHSYEDRALSIGHGQTILQPTVVAMMTEALDLDPAHRVLEVGTGTGYQTAILSMLARQVFSIERVIPLARRAGATLDLLGLQASLRIGDGYAGWVEAAPFDRILLTAAPPSIPEALLDQLAEGGLLVAPRSHARGRQELVTVRKSGGTVVTWPLEPVQFAPMIKGVTLG